MPKFHITAAFDLATVIEPEVYGRFHAGDSEDFTDNSSFGSGEVSVSGGDISFVIEADDEYDAEREAETIIGDGDEIEDDNGLTWTVEDVRIEVEPVEEPMTKERAKILVATWLNEQNLPDDVAEAFRFLLAEV